MCACACALLLVPQAQAEPSRTPLPKRTLIAASGPQRVLVKFGDAIKVRRTQAGLRSESGRDLAALDDLLRSRELVLAPVFDKPGPIERLRERARRRSGQAQPDLLGLFEVVGASFEDAKALQALSIVEFVSISAIAPPAPLDIAPPTPGLFEFQGYLYPNPGVDAISAWAQGYRGASVRLADIEYAWRLDHEEWNEGALTPEPGQTPDFELLEGIENGDHGSAVAGVLIAGDNGYGITGIAPDAVLSVYPELTIESGPRRTEAIMAAATDSAVGDIILLEMQAYDNSTNLLGPAELDEAVWMTTRMVADAGIVVVATAGNGSLDLDREELLYYRSRGDSGAIMVGAGRPGTRARLSFSTYGERLDVQGWGRDVFTTGYGDYAAYGDDLNQSYTQNFAGTSAAGPVVAGVAALVQDAVKVSGGDPLTSEQMRTVLRGTGLPQSQGDSRLIGPLPQAPAAIAAALISPMEPPSVVITNPTSTQTEDMTFSTTIDVTASPDTAYVQLSINGELQPVFDEVPPFSFAEAQFPVGTWEIVAVAMNIWDLEASSEPVTLEVGVMPPGTSSGGDESTGEYDSSGSSSGSQGTTGDDTSGADTSGADTTSAGGGSGATTSAGSQTGSPESGCNANGSASGGCRVEGSMGPGWWGLVVLWLRRRRPRRGVKVPMVKH